jgi:WD40 repeat protein
MSAPAVDRRANPYVGLVPFEEEDRLYFFGRRSQIGELLDLLQKSHFVAIIGSSGCGKSSLVRAGLIPALRAGFLVADRDRWDVVKIRPGVRPLHNLMSALDVPGRAPTTPVDAAAAPVAVTTDMVIATIRKRIGERANFLLLVDQFEEVFGFRGIDRDDPDEGDMTAGLARDQQHREADDFVALLLAIARRAETPIHIVITMRSDFLGDCDAFTDLPEAMNEWGYLVRRLRRDELRQSIEGPARLKGATLAARLVDRILNDVGDTDQLPVLQHALARTWAARSDQKRTGPIDDEDYRVAGTLATALEKHANAVLKESDPALAARVLKCLTDTDPRGRRTRRRSNLEELVRVTGATRKAISDLLEVFSKEGRDFLQVKDEQVELTHESLIRQWPKLRQWVDEEWADREQLREILRQRDRHENKKAGYLKSLDLSNAADWIRRFGPTPAWAERHGYDAQTLANAKGYVAASWWRRVLEVFIVGLAAVLLGGALYWSQRSAALATAEAKAQARVDSLKHELRDVPHTLVECKSFGALLSALAPGATGELAACERATRDRAAQSDQKADELATSGRFEESLLARLGGAIVRGDEQPPAPGKLRIDDHLVRTLRGHSAVASLLAVAGPETLVSASSDEIIAWQGQRGSTLRLGGIHARGMAAASLGDGRIRVAAAVYGWDTTSAPGESGAVGVWDVAPRSGGPLLWSPKAWSGERKRVRDVAFGSSSNAVLAAFPDVHRLTLEAGGDVTWIPVLGDDPLVRYVTTGAGPEGELLAVGYGDGPHVVAWTEGRQTRKWGLDLSDVKPRRESGSVTAAAVEPGGARVALGTGTGQIFLASLDDRSVQQLYAAPDAARVIALAYCPAPRFLVAALWTPEPGGRIVRIDAANHVETVFELGLPGSDVRDAVLLPGCNEIASAWGDKTVRISRLDPVRLPTAPSDLLVELRKRLDLEPTEYAQPEPASRVR